jgi:aminoglycoside 3-N-acetyltransferase
VHYSEQRAEVPYRYWKDFTGKVKHNGQWFTKTYPMFVRDMDVKPELRLAPIQTALEAKGEWRSAPLNYGKVAACSLRAFVATTDELLTADPWALVANKPEKAVRL